MKRYYLALLLFSVLSTNSAWSQDEKNYDAVYLSVVKEYVLNPDGSIVYNYSKSQKLLTYRAINSLYGETFVVYNPGFQKLEILSSTTTMADGKVVKAPANAFNEVLPGAAANAPDFNMLREMVITHTGLERNAVIRLNYTIRSEKGFYPALAANEVLAETEPVKSLVIRVKVPASGALSYQAFNTKAEPSKTTEGNFKVYTWRFENVPAISAEENQAGGNEKIARLVFNGEPDANKIWSWLTSQPAFSFTVNESMKRAADKLVADNSAKDKLALKVQEKVVSEVNATPVPMRFTGFRLRTPEQVWSGNYGTVPEKALLMTALLRFSGIGATPYAVQRAATCPEKFGDLYGIEDVIVKAVTPDGHVLWLSASTLNSQDLTLTLPGKVLIPLVTGGQSQTVKTETVTAKGTLTGNLYINDKNELTGELSATVTGPVNPQYSLIRDESKAKQWIAGGLGSKELKEITLSQTGKDESKFSFRVQKDNALNTDTILRTFTLPYLAQGFESFGIHPLPSYRSTPFEVPFPLDESVELTLTVPDNLVLLSSGNEVSISNAAGSFRFEIKRDAGKITISKEITIASRIIGPKDYAAFKTLVDNWNLLQYREVMFVVK
jgi:hypothetical protein